MRRQIAVLSLFTFCAVSVFGQGLNTTASKNDWEEINFEFNSHILSDGYPSLLRLAELLQKHPDFRVKVEGHTDKIGSDRYNDKLGQQRAETVKAFLLKYGAGDPQISVQTYGKKQPKVSDGTKEGRFMNRRVALTVTDGKGNIVSDGGIADAIKAIDGQQILDAQKKCCDDILKRLDKLDEIADMLRAMKAENDGLRKDLDALKQQEAALDAYVKGQPKPLTSQETASIVDARTSEQIEKARMPRFSILNANVGADGDGNLTFTGRGRFFAPFKEQFAIQAQSEFMYFHDRKEGQFDIGLVDRFIPRAQFGLFNSIKTVSLSGMQDAGTLGQGSFTLDYIFSRGKFGMFGSKGYLTGAVINNQVISSNLINQTYLSTIDQLGLSTTVGLFGNTYLEGNLGYLKSRGYADRPGGTLRFVFPLSDRFAFTLEGGVNETLVGPGNTGRVVAGFQFGNFMRPKDYLEGYNGIQHAVPADIPRVRYEMLTRQVRTGFSAPVADAGPDQIGVPSGTINLDGSGSYDPNGDPLTYLWTQISGPAVTLAGATTARASFTADDAQSYSFRLTVTNAHNGKGTARTAVTTARPQGVQIVRFQASPANINAGQSSTIDWQVLNADTVTITNLGTVDPANGTRSVSPTATTQYVLTAKNKTTQATATATVTVGSGGGTTPNLPSFLTCTVSPMNIMAGESATITYSTQNATSVSLSGIGPVAGAGQQVVTPTQTTSYILTATNATGPTTCQVTVAVTAGTVPRIDSFTANPATIVSGSPSTLSWQVENATSVSISGIGTVQPTGSQSVSPTQTTTYTLTATNATGQVTSQATITVTPVTPPGGGGAVTIGQCLATPSTSTAAGAAVTLSYTATNATSVSIAGVSGTTVAGPVIVKPQTTTTYNIVATGADGKTASCSVTVSVPVAPPGQPPVAIITGPSTIETLYRQLNLDGSTSKNPSGGALTYQWTPIGTGAAVLDQGQAVTRVQLGGLFGDYIFKLTVTNQAGQSDSTTVTVHYVNTNPHIDSKPK
jgi:hypothetical protein